MLQVCHMYDRFRSRRRSQISTMYACISQRLCGRLVDEIVTLPLLYGTCWCSPIVIFWQLYLSEATSHEINVEQQKTNALKLPSHQWQRQFTVLHNIAAFLYLYNTHIIYIYVGHDSTWFVIMSPVYLTDNLFYYGQL